MGAERRQIRASGALVAILAGLCSLGAPASASAVPRAEILSPKDDSRVGKQVVARVAVRGPRFRAYLDGENVTRSFRGKRVRRATLDLGDELRLGESDLFVRAGKRFRGEGDSAHIEVTRRSDGILKLGAQPGRQANAAPRLRGSLRKPISDLQVTLNGNRIDEEVQASSGQKRFDGSIGAHAGLRYGRNSLRLKAFQEGGRFAIEDLSFRVPRERPLVGAGPDVDGSVTNPIQLDGGSTLPVSRGRQIAYRWRLVQAPRGSDAALSDETTAQPILTPDRPGAYVVRLAASHPGGDSASDEVEVTATATDDVLGLPIQTITSEGGIQIGEPGAAGSTNLGKSGGWVQLVQIDPSSGGVLAGTSPQSFSTAQSGALVTAVENTQENALVILSGQGIPQSGFGGGVAGDLAKAIDALGGTVGSCNGCPTPTPNGAFDMLLSGNWSLIGQRGLQEGYATQSFDTTRAGVPGFLDGSPGGRGSVNGYLGQITTVGYQFVSAEYAAIDTKYTPNPTDGPPQNQNTVAITLPDGTVQTHAAPGGQIADGAIAIQALVLDQSDLSVLANNTSTVINSDGSTNFVQIFELDDLLNQYVRQSSGRTTAGEAPLIILQEFGQHSGQDWPGGNAIDWLQDTLPSTDGNRDWEGFAFPNDPADLSESWNQANVHGFGSVAGNIGILTGNSGHDIIANYRRPYWDENTNSVSNHDQSGLTVIATANAYQRSSAFINPQPNGSGGKFSNGRVAGILRRNEQSQWELGSPSSNAGFSELRGGGAFDTKAFWDLAFNTDATPFPCSAERPEDCILTDGQPAPSGQDLANAESDIAQGLFPGTGATSVRDQYPSQYENAQSLLDTLEFRVRCPNVPTGGYSCDTWNSLADQLAIELSMVENVATGVGDWSDFFSYDAAGEGQIITTAANGVITNLTDVEDQVLREEAEAADAGSIGSNALLLLSTLIEGGLAVGAPEAAEILPPTLGAISALIDLSDEVSTPRYGNVEQAVANDTEAINETVSGLEQALSDRYKTLSNSMKFFGSVFVDDYARLQAASEKFLGVWAFTVGPTSGETTNRIAQGANVAAAEALYDATLPIAFRQWIISPRYARINGLAALDVPGADSYQCLDVDNEGDQSQANPMNGSTPTSSQTSVGWYGQPSLANQGDANFNGPMSNFTVRFLKSAADNLDTEHYELNDQTDEAGVDHVGSDAPSFIFDSLFRPVNITESFMDPVSLGMGKDEFFGLPNWTILRIQCGTSNGF